ncbi:interleukin-6-like [Syngnathus typhle]|uniref:interleukin-6-like n=1 Tax=Syngnathus typhle TaxID=161592 RepID=UPI002A69AB08|nr:interleukin-6-like [Syngnathus typhle]XP_061123986.1 interleukin-6-like [Syngnathus typhle]
MCGSCGFSPNKPNNGSSVSTASRSYRTGGISEALDTQILAVGLVAFLVLRANGAPLTEATTVLPSSDTSSEEETAPSDLLTSAHVWDSVLGTAKEHQKAFDDEFQNNVNFHLLEHYKAPQFPANCPSSNFSKEACLHRLAQGLSTYIILLKHVEKEYPGSKILSEAKHYSELLLYNIKQKMRKPEEVTGLSSNEEESLLRSLYHPDAFHRKMTAHNILRKLYIRGHQTTARGPDTARGTV